MLLKLLTIATIASAAAITKRAPQGVPKFALRYAPVAYLYSGENYFPSDIASQLAHTQPEVNYTVISDAPTPLTLDNLNDLNSDGDNGEYVYLTSLDDVETNPSWLNGVRPGAKGKTRGAVSLCGYC